MTRPLPGLAPLVASPWTCPSARPSTPYEPLPIAHPASDRRATVGRAAARGVGLAR